MIFLNLIILISLSSNANIIGAGYPNSILKKLIWTVFLNTRKKLELLNNNLKCLKSFHALPHIPSAALKSLKAIITPYMGMYAKMNNKTVAGISRMYNCFIFIICLRSFLNLFMSMFVFSVWIPDLTWSPFYYLF